jgi:hypothetical protein
VAWRFLRNLPVWDFCWGGGGPAKSWRLFLFWYPLDSGESGCYAIENFEIIILYGLAGSLNHLKKDMRYEVAQAPFG